MLPKPTYLLPKKLCLYFESIDLDVSAHAKLTRTCMYVCVTYTYILIID